MSIYQEAGSARVAGRFRPAPHASRLPREKACFSTYGPYAADINNVCSRSESDWMVEDR